MKKMKILLLSLLSLFLTLNVSFVNVEALVNEESLGYPLLADKELASELVVVKEFTVLEGDHYNFVLCT